MQTIPKKFVANIREKISEQVILKVPNGKTYTVEVAEEQQNELVLRSGWAEFASAYELELGDLLVFTNNGNSHLTVRIFDRSACEKELSCVLLDSMPCMQERKCSHGKRSREGAAAAWAVAAGFAYPRTQRVRRRPGSRARTEATVVCGSERGGGAPCPCEEKEAAAGCGPERGGGAPGWLGSVRVPVCGFVPCW
ncbi:B3 domain-containing protein LOC_Os12g40080-like [Sorghum bicolor]|uniref:B3 domain-containing protein LOC_Os12g40080-like n=1 Tax=Sorghum bicolor TaxID=4558 RepID=UPI000B4256CE|nr:B3 domain-containing protein LOC_Os12g40080-like [Sorghum bicolor]|eukprot:XP_021321796.1 B3 domain-containing protein LOC_Os12g40080-like [Sorghum bicolor]